MHDAQIGRVGAYHLFRLTVEAEDAIEAQIGKQLGPAWLASVADAQIAARELSETAIAHITAPAGPIQIGTEKNLLSAESAGEIAAHYSSAFVQRARSSTTMEPTPPAPITPTRLEARRASPASPRRSASVNKKTTLLVVGDQDIRKLAGHKKSSKHRKAESLILVGQHLRILSESDFANLLALNTTTVENIPTAYSAFRSRTTSDSCIFLGRTDVESMIGSSARLTHNWRALHDGSCRPRRQPMNRRMAGSA